MEMLAQQGSGGGSWMNFIMLMAPLFVIMYVLMIRPQRVKEKARRELIEKLRKNDHVMTIGGIHGTVVTVKDNDVIIKVDESSNTKLKLAKTAIARVISDENEEDGDK